VTIQTDEGAGARVPLAERMDPAVRGRLHVRKRAGLEVIEADLPGSFRAFFTTRNGGVSIGPFASLNLDPRSEDALDSVAVNRARVSAALDSIERGAEGQDAAPSVDLDRVSPLRFVSPAQVHGTRVVGAADYVAGATTDAYGRYDQPCDGLTLHPLIDRGLAALLLFADCEPVVMAGDVDMAVVHGGWRGIVGGILEQAGRSMIGPPGLAVIGPSIGPCCFTVGGDVAKVFAGRFGSNVVSEGQVDLWAAVATALGELGLREQSIMNPRLCTCCNREFFYSYRSEGPLTGRHAVVAWAEAAA